MVSKNLIAIVALSVGLFSVEIASAQETSNNLGISNLSHLANKIPFSCNKVKGGVTGVVRNICLKSFFPIYIAGVRIGSGATEPPSDRSHARIKRCGRWWVCVVSGRWLPVGIVETVRHAECSPTFPQLKPMLANLAKVTKQTQRGTQVTSDEGNAELITFRHVHVWGLPTESLPMMGTNRCNRPAHFESSLFYPAWSSTNPVTGNLLFPEVNLISSITEGNAPAESLSAFATCALTEIAPRLADPLPGPVPLKSIRYAGCLGNGIPVNGWVSQSAGGAMTTANSSVHIVRQMLLSWRTGGYASWKTFGRGSECHPYHSFLPPAYGAFKLSMVFPYPENGSGYNGSSSLTTGMGNGLAEIGKKIDQVTEGFGKLGKVTNIFNRSSSCDHLPTRAPAIWGMHRNDSPYKAGDSDQVYVMWRWVDCCG